MRIADLPDDDLPEVAFAGRSNVGKSSLINALTGRKDIARTSNTPGRTQELNFFDLGGRLMMVDLPGYGYAKASKSKVKLWQKAMRDYLRGRASLRRAFVLIDARHGIKDQDRAVMDMLDEAAVSYQVILTKADKEKETALANVLARTARELTGHVAAYPEILVTSSRKNRGLDEVRAAMASLALPEEQYNNKDSGGA